MFGELLTLAWWLFFVIFKFIWAPVTMATTTDYLWWEVLLITMGGGLLGVFIFYNFGKTIIAFFLNRRKTPPKTFTKLNRFVARVKSKYGLFGLVAIIGIISVPLCTLIATAYFKENRRVVPALVISIVVWACSLTAVVFFLLKNDWIVDYFR